MLYRFVSFWFAALIFIGSLCADEKAPPRFAVDTPAEPHPGCTLVALADDGPCQVEQGGMTLTLPRIISLRQENSVLPPFLTKDFVLLTNGDRLPLDAEAAASLEETRLTVWPAKSLPGAHGKALPLYLPHVVLLFWTLPDGADGADRFFTKLAEETRKRDVVYLRNGDRIEGAVTALGGKVGCQLTTTERRVVQVPWGKLAGIAWNTDRHARLRTKKAYTRAALEGGARVNFTELRFEKNPRRWLGKTQFGLTLELPEQNILALDVRQGQAVDLGDLIPARYEHRPYLSVSWPLMKDRAVTELPLRIAGSTYEKGLGMHGPCEVAYKLDGQFDRFDSLIGIDEYSARHGRIRLAVKRDGKRVELNDGKELTSRDPPVSLRLDVRKVRELTLMVELGNFGDVQAQANWANPRLLKR